MFSVLPALHEDQTLYSWCGLAHALNCDHSAQATSMRLFGAPYAALSHDFPSRLDAFHDATAGALGSTREIALRNTLLGYYLAVVHRAQSEQIIARLRTGTIQHLKMLLGITASRVGGHHPLKGCPKCFAEDEASRGWAYWHVEHQPPSVLVCVKHHSPLFIAWDPVTPVHRRHWLLPRNNKTHAWFEIPVSNPRAMNCLSRLARDSQQLMQLSPSTLTPECLTRGYQQLLRKKGLATKHGNLRMGPLLTLVTEHYKCLEGLSDLAPLKTIDGQWLSLAAALSRRTPRPGHPLKHLLLIGAVSDSWEQFLATCTLDSPHPECPAAAQPDEGKQPRLMDRFRELVSKHGKSVGAASEALGFTRTTGTQWAKKLQISYTSRGRPLAASKATQVRQMLVRGDLVENIAAATGVSTTTIYRMIQGDPELSRRRRDDASRQRKVIARKSFSDCCKTQSDRTLREIRASPGNSYMWLYRNDHQWLTGKLAEYGRVSSRSR